MRKFVFGVALVVAGLCGGSAIAQCDNGRCNVPTTNVYVVPPARPVVNAVRAAVLPPYPVAGRVLHGAPVFVQSMDVCQTAVCQPSVYVQRPIVLRTRVVYPTFGCSSCSSCCAGCPLQSFCR